MFSEFETYIQTHSLAAQRNAYVSHMLKLFLSNRVAFGWIEVLDLEIFLVRCMGLWVVAGFLEGIDRN